MNLLAFITDNIKDKVSPSDMLKPLKKRIEDQLGKTIDTFSMEINTDSSELTIRADGKEHKEKDRMTCYAMKAAIKMKLGKKAPDFSLVVIHYNKDSSVGLALYLKDGSIQTEKF